MAKTELDTFDGRDNRREVLILFQRLGSDQRRARFLESLIPASNKGFAGCPMRVQGNCDPTAAYFMLVGICNELGVSINEAARRLDRVVSKGIHVVSDVKLDTGEVVTDRAFYRESGR